MDAGKEQIAQQHQVQLHHDHHDHHDHQDHQDHQDQQHQQHHQKNQPNEGGGYDFDDNPCHEFESALGHLSHCAQGVKHTRSMRAGRANALKALHWCQTVQSNSEGGPDAYADALDKVKGQLTYWRKAHKVAFAQRKVAADTAQACTPKPADWAARVAYLLFA